MALENLDENDTQPEVNEAVENLKINGSGWVYNRIASVTTDLYKDMTKIGRRYVEVPVKTLSISMISNESDSIHGHCYITQHFYTQ